LELAKPVGGIFVSEASVPAVGYVVAAATFLLFAYGLYRMTNVHVRSVLLAATIVPIVTLWLLGQFTGMWAVKGFSITWVATLLAVAVGLCRLRSRTLKVCLAFIIFAGAVVDLGTRLTSHQKEEWREATSYLAGRICPEDLVLVTADFMLRSFRRYYQGPEIRSIGVRRDLRDFAQLARLIGDMKKGHGRVWLIRSHGGDPVQDYLMHDNPQVELSAKREFVGIRMFLFEVTQSDREVGT